MTRYKKSVFSALAVILLPALCFAQSGLAGEMKGLHIVLDQLYDARSQMRKLIYAINQQPYEIQIDLMAILKH